MGWSEQFPEWGLLYLMGLQGKKVVSTVLEEQTIILCLMRICSSVSSIHSLLKNKPHIFLYNFYFA
jgi:hypothetical protein